MRTRHFVVGVLLAATAGLAGAQRLTKPWSDSPALRLTESCATNESNELFFIGGDNFHASLISAVTNQSNPDLLWKAWLPKSNRPTAAVGWSVFKYDPFQDTAEIIRSMNDDPSLTFLGMESAHQNNIYCYEGQPPAFFTRVTEYYHPGMNHYRLAVGAGESTALTADGWIPTGESFQGSQDACGGGSKVFRFSRSFAGRRGSQFLTRDPAECGHLRKNNPAWRTEDIPFFAAAPQGGACVAHYFNIPVYRAYNDRAMFNDMNHRYTTDAPRYAAMIAQGWIGEGIAFCVTGLGIYGGN